VWNAAILKGQGRGEKLALYSYSFTLKMEAIRSSETSVLIRATRRHLPEDDNHQYKTCSYAS
jgi:hypothetical protein